MLKGVLKKYSLLKFRVSPLLILYVAVFTVLGKTYEGFSYIVALIIHEFAHSEEASRRGYVLNCMHFTVFGARLDMQMQSMKGEDERAIALAGPISNFCLAVFCTALWWAFPSTYFFTLDFVWANVSLLVFNLLPVYPLDGGRIMMSLLREKMDIKKARRVLMIVGYALSLAFLVLFVVSLIVGIFNPSFVLVGVFIFISTLFPDHMAKYERLYRIAYRKEKLSKGLEVKEIAINGSVSVKKAYSMLKSDRFTCFVIVDKDMLPRKIIPETLVEKYYESGCTMGEIAQKNE